MKENYDKKKKPKPSAITIGGTVLLRNKNNKKMEPPYHPAPL